MARRSKLYGDFWSDWIDRFEDEKEVIITPDNPAVLRYAKKIGLDRGSDSWSDVTDLWQRVYDDIEYKLTWEWSTPENTLFVGFGDCEDLSFLLSSLLPHAGFNEFEFEIGYLNGQGVDDEEHVWLKVDGNIVDATGPPGNPEHYDYDPIQSWTLKVEDNKVPTV